MRTSSPNNRRARYDEPARTSSPSWRRSQYDEPARTSSPTNRRSPYEEPERTRSSLWGDESEEQPALSPLWAGDPGARRGWTRGWTRWNLSAVRGDGGKRKRWWRLPNFKDPDDRRRSLIWSAAVGLLIVSCILPSLTFVGAFAAYRHASALATDGIAQLEHGGNLMKGLAKGNIQASTTSEALQSFQNAYSDFTQLQAALGLIPGFAGGLPKYGGEIASGQQLVPIAVEASHLAVLGTDALNILLQAISNPFNKSGSGLSTGAMATINSDFNQVVALFTTLAEQIQQLSPASLTFNAKLGADITKVKAELPKAQKEILLARTVLNLLPSLLGVGTPANYLIEVLDSTELRPGGGFFGNYGVLTLSGGRIGDLKVTDIDLLDRNNNNQPFVDNPFPTQYDWFSQAEQQQWWGMRDSNLEADFPSDALYAENMYSHEARLAYPYDLRLHQKDPATYPTPSIQPVSQFQGVMAITPYLIEGMLKITGPIAVPGFKAPDGKIVAVDSSNLIDAIHVAQLGAGHGSDVVIAPGTSTSERKAFTFALFTALKAKIISLANTKRTEFVSLAVSALQTKDLQVYLGSATTPSPGEALLQQFDLASNIQYPKTGDSLFVVDANVAGNKQNQYISTTATDDILIGAQGTVTHNLTLTYNWPYSTASSNNTFGGINAFVYTDHIRIFVPPKASLIASYVSSAATNYVAWNSYQPETGNAWDFSREVFAGDLNFNYPGQVTLYFSWTVPNAAVKSGHTWTYQLVYQHQAGIPSAKYSNTELYTQTTQITLPSCAKDMKLTNLKAGKTNTVTVTEPLTTDTTYAVSYTCAG